MTLRYAIPILLISALFLAVSGCEGEGGTPAGDESGAEGPGDPEGGPTDVIDGESDEEGGGATAALTGRNVHRMTIEQLARSIPVITGGVIWEEDFGGGPIDMLQILAPTLGVPDYELVTEESLEPSLIVAKFMADAALRVCDKWLAVDQDLPQDERTFVRSADWSSLDPDDALLTLRHLQIRVFSRWVPEEGAQDHPAIAPLLAAFEQASEGAPAGLEAYAGWMTVCMAMITDPEFVIY